MYGGGGSYSCLLAAACCITALYSCLIGVTACGTCLVSSAVLYSRLLGAACRNWFVSSRRSLLTYCALASSNSTSGKGSLTASEKVLVPTTLVNLVSEMPPESEAHLDQVATYSQLLKPRWFGPDSLPSSYIFRIDVLSRRCSMPFSSLKHTSREGRPVCIRPAGDLPRLGSDLWRNSQIIVHCFDVGKHHAIVAISLGHFGRWSLRSSGHRGCRWGCTRREECVVAGASRGDWNATYPATVCGSSESLCERAKVNAVLSSIPRTPSQLDKLTCELHHCFVTSVGPKGAGRYHGSVGCTSHLRIPQLGMIT